MRSTRPARPCEWCGRYTRALDDDGDPACPSGVGCQRSSHSVRGFRGEELLTIGDARRTLDEWAALLGVGRRNLCREAVRSGLALLEHIERRLQARTERAARAAARELAKQKRREAGQQIAARLRERHPKQSASRALAAAAEQLGLSVDALRKRLVRFGSIDAAIAAGPKYGSGGRSVHRDASVAELARRVGLTRQGLYKAAKRAGHSLDAELALREAKKVSAA